MSGAEDPERGIGESSRRRLLLKVTATVVLGAAVGVAVWSATRSSNGPELDTAPSPGTIVVTPTNPPTSLRTVGPTYGDAGAASGPTHTGPNRPGREAAPDAEFPTPPAALAGAASPFPALDVPDVVSTPQSAVDALVAGFPAEVIALAATSTVLSSSVSSDGRWLQVSVEATDTSSVDGVLARYTTSLTSLGFVATESPAIAGSKAVAFVRDSHTLVLTARPQADGAMFSITGTLDEAS